MDVRVQSSRQRKVTRGQFCSQKNAIIRCKLVWSLATTYKSGVVYCGIYSCLRNVGLLFSFYGSCGLCLLLYPLRIVCLLDWILYGRKWTIVVIDFCGKLFVLSHTGGEKKWNVVSLSLYYSLYKMSVNLNFTERKSTYGTNIGYIQKQLLHVVDLQTFYYCVKLVAWHIVC